MKLVINIDEEKYKWLKEHIPKADKNSIVGAVVYGVPLPKRHGRKRGVMTKLFLSLDDAVRIAELHFGVDAEIACQEFEQKCYISDGQYSIGYNDGLDDAIKAIKQKVESEDADERG